MMDEDLKTETETFIKKVLEKYDSVHILIFSGNGVAFVWNCGTDPASLIKNMRSAIQMMVGAVSKHTGIKKKYIAEAILNSIQKGDENGNTTETCRTA